MRLILAWLLAILALAASPAHAAYPPPPDGPVLDQAGIIPAADEAALDAKLRGYNTRTGRALVVATVSSLDGETVEMYAVRLFETWGIGGKESDQGLLFLIAPKEHKLRFETGYGLHGVFPDVLAGRVIRNDVTPRFKAGDMPGGINAGIDAVIAQLERNPADAKAVVEAAATAKSNAQTSDGVGAGSVIFWIVLILFFLMLFGRRRRGYRRSGFGRGVGVWDVGQVAANIAINVALNAALGGDSDGGGGSDGGGFGGFGGGMSGGGGASGDW
jgi:uncharacterized protein